MDGVEEGSLGCACMGGENLVVYKDFEIVVKYI